MLKKAVKLVSIGTAGDENSKLFRNTEGEAHPEQKAFISLVNILHMSTMCFEEEIMFYDRSKQKKFTSTFVTKILPLIQAMNIELSIEKQGSFVRKELDKPLETVEKMNAILEEKSLPELPQKSDPEIFKILATQIKTTAINAVSSESDPDPSMNSMCLIRASCLLLRHFTIYWIVIIKFSADRESSHVYWKVQEAGRW